MLITAVMLLLAMSSLLLFSAYISDKKTALASKSFLKVYSTVPEKQYAESIKEVKKQLRRLITCSDTVVEAFEDDNRAPLKMHSDGQFLTLEADANVNRLIIIDPKYNILNETTNDKAIDIPGKELIRHESISLLIKQSKESEDLAYTRVNVNNKITNIAVDPIYDFDDELVGYGIVCMKPCPDVKKIGDQLHAFCALISPNADSFRYSTNPDVIKGVKTKDIIKSRKKIISLL